jgi:hypothetical protein
MDRTIFIEHICFLKAYFLRGEMPIYSEVIKSRRLVSTRAEGFLTIRELVKKQEDLLNHPDFDPLFDHLFDMSGITSVEDLKVSELQRLASVRIFSASSRRAIVAPGDLVFGFSRMYEVFSNSTEANYSVFRNRDDALKWLEVNPEDLLS